MVTQLLKALTVLGTVGGLAFGGLALVGMLVPPAGSDTLTIPNTFSVGQVADPTTVNANFSAIANVVNGGIDNDNWDPAGPDLNYANMNFVDDIVASDIADDAVTTNEILDGTVAQIDMADNATHALTKLSLPCDTSVDNDPGAFVLRAAITAYSPVSTSSTLLIHYMGQYNIFETADVLSSTVFVEVRIDGNTVDCQNALQLLAPGGDATVLSFYPMDLTCLVAAPAGFPYDIEIFDKYFFSSDGNYDGTLNDCRLSVLEFTK